MVIRAESLITPFVNILVCLLIHSGSTLFSVSSRGSDVAYPLQSNVAEISPRRFGILINLEVFNILKHCSFAYR